MIRLKTIDYTIQIVLIVGSVIISLLFRDGGVFFFTYFIVGGWQVLSALAHFFYPMPVKTTMRRIYLFALLAVLLVALVATALDSDTVIYLLFALLIVSPIMAIFYVVTCYRETNELKEMAAATGEPVQPNS